MNDRLVRNSVTLFLSEGFNAFLVAATSILIARLMNVADFGKFITAMAFSQILLILVDPGMGQFTAKALAKNRESSLSQVHQIVSWRILLIVAVSVVAPVVAGLLFSSSTVKTLASWLTPAVLAIGMVEFLGWIFKGIQQVIWTACLQMFTRILLIGLVWMALLSAHQMAALLLAHWIAGFSGLGFGFYLVARRLHGVKFAFPSRSFFKETLPEVYKLGAIIIIAIASVRLDILLVAKFCGDASAGLFAAGGRIIDGLRLVIPTVIYSTHLPAFVASADQIQLLRSKFRRAMTFLMASSVLLALGGSLYAEPLFVALFGSPYRTGALYFIPLIWSNIFMFPNVLMFAVLYALNDHKTLAYAVTASFLIDLAANFLFLPRFGPIVASWARLAAELCNFAIQAQSLMRRRVIGFQDLVIRPGVLVAAAALACVAFSAHSPSLRLAAAVVTALGTAALLLRSNSFSKGEIAAPLC